ncbi:hypothetical protein BELL_0314g00130 [Botrytis elliptica]|uniref:Uncharacterized protein n=1 Tax=Botrytis elliptica TaxID=278938 RepID=A0A4Z1JL51_9HELO|nr:hypothetical protein EAE99_008493 [Botrytis elliptica]TGO74034.1 hypothetical protein BELL_0314g00130 [Botrytis elliptica]
MGCKNNRGQAKLVPMSVKIAQEQNNKKEELAAKMAAADKKWYEQRDAWNKLQLEKKNAWKKLQWEKKAAEEKKLADKKITEENAKKVAATIQFECIQKHYALVLKQNGDDKQLVIDLNFIADPPTDMLALMKVLPEYSAAITKVQVKLIQPMQHGSRAIYNQRVQNMNKLIEQLNTFPLTELNVLVDVNSHENFHQFKLAAAFNGLNFEDWTMDFQIMAGPNRYSIDPYSSYGKRLRGVYRTEFCNQ